MPSYSADFRYLEMALVGCKPTFEQLKTEMNNFVARTRSDFEVERRKMWETMRPLNAHLSDQELNKFIQNQIDSAADPRHKFVNKFSEPFSAQAISIVVLSHALCEAFINAALALGLHHVSKDDIFSLIEKADVKEKWVSGPSIFLESYVLPKGGQTFENLTTLCKIRNSYAHHKIGLFSSNGGVVHDRNKLSRFRMDARGIKNIETYFALPFELLKNLCTHTTDLSLQFTFETLASTS